MGGFKGLFNIIVSKITDTNKPINNKACANDETVVVLKDKNKKNRERIQRNSEPNIRKNV
jgi:hypothetical protein